MRLLTKEHERRLLSQGRWNAGREKTEDFKPIVKLFCPWSGATWLLSELDPDDPDIAFGLCDLGMGSPELGRVRLSELAAVRGPGDLSIERDRWFRARKTLKAYVDEARRRQRIVA
jgi:Protein of unknown function (DUF2958)